MRPKSFHLLAILSLAIVVLVALMLALPSAAQAQRAGTIVVGTSTDPDYPPFEIARGNSIHGFDIDLVKEIAKRAGFKVEWQVMAFPDLFPALGDGTLDMVASALTITPVREPFMDFSDPYYYLAATAAEPEQYYGLGFPEGSELRTVVNAALQTIKDDGTYAKLYHKWFGVVPSVIP